MNKRYPRLEINLSALSHNVKEIVNACAEQGVAAVSYTHLEHLKLGKRD